MKIIITIFFTLIAVLAQGTSASILSTDDKTPSYLLNVVPPSPSAFKFSTYGNIPLNGSTGGFNYSLPLYTITDKDISLPITLDYYSNGVKIDELAGIVGTDWNLNAGGVISRIMRGKPDENSERWYPENIHKGVKSTDEKVYGVATGYSNIDMERDWFSFNVNGISGTFYFDENLNVIVSSKEYVKIIFKNEGYFILIDNKGYQYVFDNTETSRPTSLGTKGEPIEEYVSSWFLTKIISPNQNEINLTYIDNHFSYIPSISFHLLYDRECSTSGLLLDHIVYYNQYVSFNTIQSKVISKITFSNGSVNFDYNTDRLDGRGLSLKSIQVKSGNNLISNILFEYETVYTNISHPVKIVNDNDNIKYRCFLKSAQMLGAREDHDGNGNTYVFDYYEKEKLPIRLSLSKDEYGYNNESNNYTAFSSKLSEDKFISLFFKKYGNTYAKANREVNPSVVYYGMLKEIRYPTGGYSRVSYEANSTLEKATELKYKASSYLYVRKGGNIAGSENSKSLKFTANGTDIYFTANASLVSGEPDDHDQYRVRVKDITADSVYMNRTALFGESMKTEYCIEPIYTTLAPVSTVKGHEYEITLSLESKDFNTASASMQIQYNADTVFYDKTVYGGGARVKEISDYVTEKSTATNKRSFYYSALENYPNAKTSLNKIIQQQPYVVIPYTRNCLVIDFEKTDLVKIIPISSEKVIISASTVDHIYNSRKQSSYYTVITEFQEKNGIDNGAIEKRFHDISHDYPANFIYEKGVTGAPYSNGADAYYGLVDKESIFEKKLDRYSLLKTKDYVYTSLNLQLLSSYIFQQNYEVPFSVGAPTKIELDIERVAGAKYFNYIENVKCTSSIESIYDGSRTLKTETTNVYGDSPYFNLKNQSVSSSTTSLLQKKYLYASDLVGQLSFMDKLVEANKVGIPIISETKKKEANSTEKQISYLKTTYNEFVRNKGNGTTLKSILPEFVYSPTSTDKRASYNKYDEYGNIIYYLIDDATKIVYLWGYNGQYPIAEIKNATYDQVKSALGITPESLSSAVSPNATLINGLRTNANLAEALITTYTYKPLVGILTATDPRGVTTYYNYDVFGRLKETYIMENGVKKVVQVNDYHYQNK